MNKLVLSIGVVWVLLSLVIGVIIAITPRSRQVLPAGKEIGYVPEVASTHGVATKSSDDQVITKVTITDQLNGEQVSRSDFVRASVKVKK